jgi:hypothetical protein
VFGSRERSSRTARRWITWLVLSCLLVGARASAQDVSQPQPRSSIGRWGLIDAVGYGGVGLVAGYAFAIATMADGDWVPSDGAIMAIPALTAVGMLAGAVVGHNASSRLRNGEPLGGGSRFAVTAGAVLAGATLGAALSYPLIAPPEREGTPLGSDESTVALMMGVGAAIGTAYVLHHSGDFDDVRVSVAPIRTRDAAYGIRVAVRY